MRMIRNYIISWKKCNLPMKKFMNGKSWAKKDRSSGGMALLPLATGTSRWSAVLSFAFSCIGI
jgi:hypothetical protein